MNLYAHDFVFLNFTSLDAQCTLQSLDNNLLYKTTTLHQGVKKNLNLTEYEKRIWQACQW